jgi:hypothetical protein
MPETELLDEEPANAPAPATDVAPSALAPTETELRAVRRSLRFLRRDNPARRLAECALAGEPPESDLVEAVLERLDRFRPAQYVEPQLSAWAIGVSELTTQQERSAIGRLDAVVAGGWAAQSRDLAVTAAVFLVSYIGVLWGCAAIFHQLGSFGNSLTALSAALLTCGGATALLTDRSFRKRTRVAAMTALARLKSVEGLPALATALRDPTSAVEVQMAAARAVRMLLPRLSEQDTEWLDAGTLRRLVTALRSTNEPLVLAIIDAFGKVGDGRVLREVERAVLQGRTQRVRDAANAILPVLRERHRQAQDAARLLRPASAPEDNTLLRPASGPPEADPAVLLRPGDAKDV